MNTVIQVNTDLFEYNCKQRIIMHSQTVSIVISIENVARLTFGLLELKSYSVNHSAVVILV